MIQTSLSLRRCSQCDGPAPELVEGTVVACCGCDRHPQFDDLGRYLEPPPAGIEAPVSEEVEGE